MITHFLVSGEARAGVNTHTRTDKTAIKNTWNAGLCFMREPKSTEI